MYLNADGVLGTILGGSILGGTILAQVGAGAPSCHPESIPLVKTANGALISYRDSFIEGARLQVFSEARSLRLLAICGFSSAITVDIFYSVDRYFSAQWPLKVSL